LRWEVDGQWVSASVDQQLTSDRVQVAGHPLYGTAVSYRLTRAFELHARIDNLTDTTYETFIGFPGPERSWRLGLRWLGSHDSAPRPETLAR
jgi:outer membrane cobalamin receptor